MDAVAVNGRLIAMRGHRHFVGMLAPVLCGDGVRFEQLPSGRDKRGARQLLKADALYYVGGGVRSRLAAAALLMGKPVVMHWVGSDVLHARDDTAAGRAWWPMVRRCEHWTEVPWIAKELLTIGIKAKVVPLTTAAFPKEIAPLPERFTVLAYLPSDRADFYGASQILSLAKVFTEARFIVLASTRDAAWLADKELPANVEMVGFKRDMHAVYSESTVLVRLTAHDGLSFMVLEALAHGRYVVWNHPLGPYPAIKTYQDAHDRLSRLLDLYRAGTLAINRVGATWVRKHLSVDGVGARIRDEFRVLLGRKNN